MEESKPPMLKDSSLDLHRVPMEWKACPLGCRGEDGFVLKGRDRLHNLPGEFTVVRCKTCGLMRTNPRPNPDAIVFYYPDHYGPFQYKRLGVRPGESVRSHFWKQAARKIAQVNDNPLPFLKPGRMLEIGCASGGFMHQMSERGWEVEGIEPSSSAAARARELGFQVFNGSLEAAPEPLAPYDLIVGWMVFEHLHEPVNSLKKLKQWSSIDGWLVISVPNAASWEFRCFQHAWYALQLPTHLFHFSPRTIRITLERGGWRVEKIFHQKNLSNFIASMGYVLRDRGFFPRLAKHFLEYPEKPGKIRYPLFPLAWLASFFGQTGRMTIWARRKN
jgi:SAM-dependent methyltransferase